MSNKKHPEQNTPKVIINGLGVPYVFDDSSGKYGVTQIPLFVLEPSKNEKIFLFSRLFQYLIWAYRIQGNNNDPFLFDVLPDLNRFKYKTENEMLKELDMSAKDESEISAFNVPKFSNVEKREEMTKGARFQKTRKQRKNK